MNSRSIPSSYTRLDRSSSNGTNRNGTGRNGNTRSRRRPRWHRGSRLPSGILPPLPSSLDVATNTNTEDCVANALAVLRSTKRPKYCVDEEEAQQHYQDDNDSNDSESNSPQTPSIDNDAPTFKIARISYSSSIHGMFWATDIQAEGLGMVDWNIASDLDR